MGWFRFLAFVSLLSPLLGAGRTHAQAPDAESDEVVATPQTTGEQEEDREARALYEAGEIAYEGARYAAALESFQRAYALSGRTELLYNIGLSADRVRQDSVAIEAFERFLELLPEHPKAEAVRGRIALLRSQAQRTETRALVETPSRAGPWALGLGGGVVLIGGAVLLAMAIGDKNEVEALSTARWSDIEAQVESVPRRSGAGIALMAAGGAAVLGAIAWRLLTPSEIQEETLQLEIGVGQVHLRGRF